MRRRHSLWVAYGVVILLSLCVFAANWRNLRAEEALRIEATRHQQMVWEALKVDSAHGAAHVGTMVFRPLPALSVVDSGLVPFAGSWMVLRAHSNGDLHGAPLDDAPEVPREGFFSLASIIEVLFPLLLALIVGPSLASEREIGILPLLLSQGVSRSAIAAGKLASSLAPLLALLGALAVVCVGMVAIGFGLHEATAALPRLLLMFLVYAVWLFIAGCVFLGISARARSSRASVAVCLGVCVLCCLASPPLAQHFATAAWPMPTLTEMEASTKAGMARLDGANWERRRQAIVADLMKEYHVADEKYLPVDPGGFLLQEWEELGAQQHGARADEIAVTERKQLRAVQWSGLLTLAPAVQALSFSIAGTGPDDLLAFQQQAETVRFRTVQLLNEDQKNNPPGLPRTVLVQRFAARRAALFRNMPALHFVALPLGEAMRYATPALLALLFWTVLAPLFALWSTQRMKVSR